MRVLVTAFLLASVVSGAQTQQATNVEGKSTLSAPDPAPSPATLISRAKPLELDTPYVPPPGDPLSYHAAGFAKVMCSAVFITGLDPDFAAENVGYFTAPYELRAKLGKPVVGACCGDKWVNPHRCLPRGSGMRNASRGKGVGQLQTRGAQEQPARCLEAGMAHGRCDAK